MELASELLVTHCHRCERELNERGLCLVTGPITGTCVDHVVRRLHTLAALRGPRAVPLPHSPLTSTAEHHYVVTEPAPITVLIDSLGGEAGAGFRLIDVIQGLGKTVPIHTRALGMAASMAALILQAGTRREMGRFATLMLHAGQWSLEGSDSQVFEDYKRLAAIQQEQICSFLAERNTAGKDFAYWKKLIWKRKSEYWMDAAEALSLGLIDGIWEGQ